MVFGKVSIEFACQSLPSTVHPENNFDAFFTDQKHQSAGVFDGLGLGGYQAGEVASQTARFFQEKLAVSPFFQKPQDYLNYLEVLVEEAHQFLTQWIFKNLSQSQKLANTDQAGTTATVIKFLPASDKQTNLLFVHLGDCRLYLARQNQSFRQLTVDDSLLSQAVLWGAIQKVRARKIDQLSELEGFSEREINFFRQRAVLTQALGIGVKPKPASGLVVCQTGDKIILCSDGVSDNLLGKEIEKVAFGDLKSLAETAELLVKAARKVADANSIRSKSDDMTVVLAKIK